MVKYSRKDGIFYESSPLEQIKASRTATERRLEFIDAAKKKRPLNVIIDEDSTGLLGFNAMRT